MLEGIEAELATIDKNLIRDELTIVGRREYLKRREEIYETRPKMGRSSRVISEEIQIAKNIIPKMKEVPRRAFTNCK